MWLNGGRTCKRLYRASSEHRSTYFNTSHWCLTWSRALVFCLPFLQSGITHNWYPNKTPPLHLTTTRVVVGWRGGALVTVVLTPISLVLINKIVLPIGNHLRSFHLYFTRLAIWHAASILSNVGSF
uniref:Uncharacterized protein n=1 Tax=Morchella brunnea TaxID=1174671 RepID=A0A8K1I7N2_9PEZI|nr:hypothetical protein LK370_mgp154 [Morchella brunnea]UBU98376.1 hypothetical protein [Morchella brunnea]